MIASLFDETERAKIRRGVVAFWCVCIGHYEGEIARRLNLTLHELRYIFPEQLEDGPCTDIDAVIAMYRHAIGGDVDAMLIFLAATQWHRHPFAEMLAMPERHVGDEGARS